MIAEADPPLHALIDVGALITGMTNEQVALHLCGCLPAEIEGVIYLDSADRKQIIVRASMKTMRLEDCGLDKSQRFTYFDEAHTTGMDIPQGLDAGAALTLGNDTTFRDYAQGAYRMRGIGKGQTLKLLLTPENAAGIDEYKRMAPDRKSVV